jgi:hypothetical protein
MNREFESNPYENEIATDGLIERPEQKTTNVTRASRRELGLATHLIYTLRADWHSFLQISAQLDVTTSIHAYSSCYKYLMITLV